MCMSLAAVTPARAWAVGCILPTSSEPGLVSAILNLPGGGLLVSGSGGVFTTDARGEELRRLSAGPQFTMATRLLSGSRALLQIANGNLLELDLAADRARAIGGASAQGIIGPVRALDNGVVLVASEAGLLRLDAATHILAPVPGGGGGPAWDILALPDRSLLVRGAFGLLKVDERGQAAAPVPSVVATGPVPGAGTPPRRERFGRRRRWCFSHLTSRQPRSPEIPGADPGAVE